MVQPLNPPKDLGVFILPVPTPFPVGNINLYLVRKDPITLIDTGPRTPQAYRALLQGLKEIRLRPSDIQRLVITHPHVDHFGLAGELKRHFPKMEVAYHKNVQPLLASIGEMRRSESERVESLFTASGMPPDLRAFLLKKRTLLEKYAEEIRADRMLEKGKPIAFDAFELEVIPTPGHTPWCLSFYWKDERVLFSGDFILEHITPNPLFHGNGQSPLISYRDSLERVSKLELRWILGGHGAPIERPAQRIQRLLKLGERRSERVKKTLCSEPKTLFALATELFPGVALEQPFLVLSEVYAHLQWLLERGEAIQARQNGSLVFHTTS
jgi:glyoxylase-like metal-dependent hydrolase (beta-lactamase superfamily II)